MLSKLFSLCFVEQAFFYCLNGNILDILAPKTSNTVACPCLLSTWLLLAVLNLRQIADRISKEKYEMTMHFCVCSMQIHIWIAVQKYLFAYFLVYNSENYSFKDLFESFHNYENHSFLYNNSQKTSPLKMLIFQSPLTNPSNDLSDLILWIRTKDWLINQVNDFGLLWYASLFLVATP